MNQNLSYSNFKHVKCYVNNGVGLHVRVGGNGPAVLLMHGWFGTSYTWRYVAPIIANAGYQVICPDMRGYGDSDKPYTGYDGLTLVEDMRQMLQQIGVSGKVHVGGWDMGALPAYLYAAHHPDEVATLAYMDEPLPSVNLQEATTFRKETYGGYFHFGFNHAPDLAELLIAGKEREFWNFWLRLMLYNPASITEADKDEYLRTYAAAGGVRGSVGWYRDALITTDQFAEAIAKGKLKMPVAGWGGQFGTPNANEQLNAITDDPRGGIIPECGHLIAEEQPEFLAQKLLELYAIQTQ